jgi:hypothetical protein
MATLITGPPRSRKTYNAVNYWVNSPQESGFSGEPGIIISRTKENALQTYQTIQNHIDGLDDIKVMFYFGVGEVCPSVDEQKTLQLQRIQHHQNCKANRNPVKVDHDTLNRITAENGLISESWNALYENGECPWAAQNALLSRRSSTDERILIITTYASLPVIDEQHPEIFSDSCVILDEARHYINHVPVEQISLGKGLKYSKIFEDYRKDIENINLDEYFEDEEENRVKESIKAYLDYLDTVLRYTIKARKLENSTNRDKEVEERVDKRFNAGARLTDILDPEEWEPDFETYYWLQKELEEGESSKFPGERIHDAYSKPNISFLKKWIDRVDNKLKSSEAVDRDGIRLFEFLSNARRVIEDEHAVRFDLVDTQDQESSLMMYIISKSEVEVDSSTTMELESRPLLSKIRQGSNSLILVDSTFFPEKFWNFFFGNKIELDRISLQADYEFAIVVEDAKYPISQTYRSQTDRNRLIKKVKGIQRRLIDEEKSPVIFARNKDESQMLLDSGIDPVFYSRGTEVEGTEVEGDFTINCGIPLQNIHSENYRKYDIARSLWLDNNDEAPDKIVDEYRKVKAYQELLQQSFRTVKQDGFSGTLWLNTAFSVLQKMEEYWRWITDFRQVKMSKSKNKELSEKIEEAVHGLLYGEDLQESLREKEVREEITDRLENKSDPKKEEFCEEIREDLEVRKGTVHRILDELIQSGEIQETKEKTGNPGRPPVVLKPSPSS